MLLRVTPKQKLADLVKELRGERSQRSFAKLCGVSNQAVQNWEKGQTWPDDDNLQRLAGLKGWTLKQLRDYLEDPLQAEKMINYVDVNETSGQTVNVQQLLAEVRSLPLEVLAQVASVAVETLANRSIASQTLRKSIPSPADEESALSA